MLFSNLLVDERGKTPLPSHPIGDGSEGWRDFRPSETLTLWPVVPRGFATWRTERLTSMGVGLQVWRKGNYDESFRWKLTRFCETLARPIDCLSAEPRKPSRRLGFSRFVVWQRRRCGVRTGNSANIACHPFSLFVRLSSRLRRQLASVRANRAGHAR